MFPMYEDVRRAVAEVLDPASLAYVVCPHFEADECGDMGRFVAEAPEAVLACSDAGAMLNLTQWDYAGPVQGFRDGEIIDLGEHKRAQAAVSGNAARAPLGFDDGLRRNDEQPLSRRSLHPGGVTNRPSCERT
jgi:hypothetical protein